MEASVKAPCVLTGWEVRERVFVCAPPHPRPSYLALVSGHMCVVIILIFARTKNSKQASVSFYRSSRVSLNERARGTTRSHSRIFRPLALAAADSAQKVSGPTGRLPGCGSHPNTAPAQQSPARPSVAWATQTRQAHANLEFK